MKKPKYLSREKYQRMQIRPSKLICEKMYSFDMTKRTMGSVCRQRDYLTAGRNEFLKFCKVLEERTELLFIVRTTKSIKYLGIGKSVKIRRNIVG